MTTKQQPTRRQFLAGSSAVAAVALTGVSQADAAATDRLQVAFIGVGRRGGANIQTMTHTGLVDVYALCDVDSRSLEAAANRFPAAKQFRDFRQMYDAIGTDIDAVVVSSTEHTHAFATMPALQLGKHVYCEKPLCYNIEETRKVTEAAAKAGVSTQMGTQIHAGDNYHRVVELIRSGAIGRVDVVHVWVNRAWGLQSEADAKKNKDPLYVTERPAESMPVPDYLDWDLWIGPAPWRPYHDAYYPGPKWYRWWDFGNGTMSDLGSHWNDLPYWALELDAPTTVEAFGPPAHPELAPASMTAHYEYPARGDRAAVTLNWYQGTHKPEIWKRGEIPQWNSGVLFVGSEGMLLSDYGKHKLLPEEKFADFERPEKFVPDSPGQHEEWIQAALGNGQTASPFSYAGPLTEANHLGNVAYRVGEKITWDAKSMKCVGCPDAQRFIKRQPRDGWSLA